MPNRWIVHVHWVYTRRIHHVNFISIFLVLAIPIIDKDDSMFSVFVRLSYFDFC